MITAAVREALVIKFTALLPHLDERQRRLLLGAEAASLGRGGIAAVALAAGVSVPTVTKGLAEVGRGEPPSGRVRAAGGGRKRLTQTDPGLVAAPLKIQVSRKIGSEPMPQSSQPRT